MKVEIFCDGACSGNPGAGVFFTPNDPAPVDVSVKTQTVQGVRLYIKTLDTGAPVVQARLGDSAGQVVAQQEVDEFTLCSQATMYIGVVETFPDGAKLLETNTVPDGKRSEDSGIQGQNNTGQWDCGGY
jgi:hypothetical protein